MSQRKYSAASTGEKLNTFLQMVLKGTHLDVKFEIADADPRPDDFETPDVVVRFTGRDVDHLLGNKAELQAFHDMLVVVRDRVAKLVRAGKTQEQVVAARPTKEFEEKYGGTSFNAGQWIGRAYVDQKRAHEMRRRK